MMNPIIAGNKISHWLRVSTLHKDVGLAVAIVLTMFLANSCSTARGFGQDVEKTGDKIQEAATQ